MIASILAILGSLCFLIASIGLFKMPDSLARIHAATKASALGVLLLIAAAIASFRTIETTFTALLILVLVFLTAPMACQAIASRIIATKKKTNQ